MEKSKIAVVSVAVLFALSVIAGFINLFKKPQKFEKSPSMNLYLKNFGLKKEGNVAVIYIKGTLEFGYSEPSIFPTGIDEIVNQIKDVEDDTSIEAVIIKINSPGGTVAASQELYSAIKELKNKGKFVVAVIEDVGASGGYYVASACDYIVARPGSITGSIGVISIVPNVKNLLNKIGVSVKVIKSGKFKDMGSSFKDMTPDEEKMFKKIIKIAYRQFFNAVLKGRKGKITQSELKKIADGRILLGSEALKHGLIDSLGGMNEALKIIEEKTGITPQLTYPQKDKFEDILKTLFNIKTSASLSVSEFIKSIKKPTIAYLYLGEN